MVAVSSRTIASGLAGLGLALLGSTLVLYLVLTIDKATSPALDPERDRRRRARRLQLIS